jgi:plasmid stabilization system protein ParE
MSEQLQTQILDGVAQLSTANQQLAKACRELADAEHKYRQKRAEVYTNVVTDGEKRTVDHIKAIVDLKCDTQMLRVRLAEADKESALQLVLSLRTQISAVQSLLRCDIEEAAALRYGQQVGA